MSRLRGRAPLVSMALRGALAFSAFAAFAGRSGWFVRQYAEGTRLQQLAFVWLALPALVVFVAVMGSRSLPDRQLRRRLQQQWASLFLGLCGVLVYYGHLCLPGLWPFALFVPTAWLFVPFLRVKADEPGALDAFATSARVEAVKEVFRAFLDQIERPGWRERLEAELREAEASGKARSKTSRRSKPPEPPAADDPSSRSGPSS